MLGGRAIGLGDRVCLQMRGSAVASKTAAFSQLHGAKDGMRMNRMNWAFLLVSVAKTRHMF